MFVKIFKIIFLVSLILVFQSVNYAYDETHPPYTFKQGPFKSIAAKPIYDWDHQEYKSTDGKTIISVKKSVQERFWDYLFKDNGYILAKRHIDYAPIPFEIYQEDVNGDGLKDFVVLLTYMTNGMSFLCERVEIYLKKRNRGYRQIAYDAVDVNIKDFVDLNNDGKYEAIITGLYGQMGTKQDSRTHSYFSYSIYEFTDYRLVNADRKFKGFPKFVWFTDKANDNDTIHLTKKERQRHVSEKNASIKYEKLSE